MLAGCKIMFAASLFSKRVSDTAGGRTSGLAPLGLARIRQRSEVRVAALLAGLQKTRGNRKLRLASESITRYLSNTGPTRARARSKRFVRCGDFFRIYNVARRQNGPFLMAPAWHSKDISVVKGSTNNSWRFQQRLFIAL